MRKQHDIVSIDAVIKHETEKAYLIDDGKKGVWIAKSMCEFTPLNADSTAGELQLREWLALEKGLI